MDDKVTWMEGLLEVNEDFEERLQNNEIRVSYDNVHDMLLITIGQPQEAITEEVAERLHLRLDPVSDKIVGITITAFKKGFLRENPDFKRHFQTVFASRKGIDTWEVAPRTETSERASSALRGLVSA